MIPEGWQALVASAKEVVRIRDEAPYGVSFGSFMERAVSDLRDKIETLAAAPSPGRDDGQMLALASAITKLWPDLAEEMRRRGNNPDWAIEDFLAVLRASLGKDGPGEDGIYVASRASIPARAAMWRSLRDIDCVPIVASWIDEDGEGQTKSFAELWSRIVAEIAGCKQLVLYAESADFPLKGALVEVGIAIGMGKPVAVCLPGVKLDGRSHRPLGSWIECDLVTRCDDIRAVLRLTSGDGGK